MIWTSPVSRPAIIAARQAPIGPQQADQLDLDAALELQAAIGRLVMVVSSLNGRESGFDVCLDFHCVTFPVRS
jgi:hypothetical protein